MNPQRTHARPLSRENSGALGIAVAILLGAAIVAGAIWYSREASERDRVEDAATLRQIEADRRALRAQEADRGAAAFAEATRSLREEQRSERGAP